MRLLLCAALVTSSTIVAACGASSHISTSSTLPPELAAAITRTIAATSIEATETDSVSQGPTTTGGQGAGSLTVIYQAPDRLEFQGGTHFIWIGTTTYAYLSSSFLSPPGQSPVSIVGRPTGWIETTQPKQTTATIQARVFGLLELVQRAQSVSTHGSAYSFRYHDHTAQATLDASGTVEVAAGMIASISVSSIATNVTETFPGGATVPPVQRETQDVIYSHYNSAPPVSPPPASEVTVVPLNSGGVVTATVAAPPVHLPKPTVTGHSPMQFRPVQSTSTSPCPATSTTDPPADQPATLPAVAGGTCYDLAPAALAITKVASIEVVNDVTGKQGINLTFEPADAAAFDRDIGGQYYQHQVAIVMFGLVLEAPTINATQFNGQATISGLDPQTEANVIAALTG